MPGTERELACDLVLLAMGFTGAEDGGLVTGLGVGLDERGRVPRDDQYATSVPGVFVAGDMGRGQSLIVWAIAEGRSAAAAADRYLAGETALPAAIPASAAPLRLSHGWSMPGAVCGAKAGVASTAVKWPEGGGGGNVTIMPAAHVPLAYCPARPAVSGTSGRSPCTGTRCAWSSACWPCCGWPSAGTGRSAGAGGRSWTWRP